MDLSFAKDNVRFSKAVEQIRKAKEPMTNEHIKEVYDSLEGPKAIAPENTLPEEQVGVAKPEDKPAKKVAKKAAKKKK